MNLIAFCALFLQDQYDKLLKNYEAMGVDRGFMVESMTVLKKRNEELVSELQQCKVCTYVPIVKKVCPSGQSTFGLL